jgi:predicted esterase
MAPERAKRYPWSEGADCFVYPPVASGGSPGQQHPILCFLHGRGEAVAGENPDGIAAHGSPAWHAQTGSALTDPFLVVCPQRREIGRWDDTDAAKLHLVLDQIVSEHKGDADKVFLTGFSLGGDAVFWFASYPRGDRFQRLWAVDPALRSDTPIPPPGRPVLLHHGFAMRHLVSEFKEPAGLVECPGRGALTGDRLICDLGLEHVATCRAAYGEKASYDWLLSAAGPAETKV